MVEEKRPVFIFDGSNVFIRAYSAFPQMSSLGYQMGGCIGFLKSLQRLCREFQPSRVVIAWEGGGSSRRRKMYPDYKQNRRPERLNRFYGDDIPDTEENRQHQLISLLGMLKNVPVCQVYVPNCEGDDIVAYLCSGPLKRDQKVIVSSDKDMYQLLNDTTRIYSPHKKGFVTQDSLLEEFKIASQNFALAKSLCGDVSDNIPGVKGVGFKTVASKFPFLSGATEILLQELLDYAAAKRDESVLYKRIVESQDDVKRNWRLIHLDGSMLSGDQAMKVENVISTFEPRVNKMGLIRSLLKEGINDFDVEGFYYDLSCIEGLKYASEKNT